MADRRMLSYAELESLPTLSQGQADDLKFQFLGDAGFGPGEGDAWRVWLCRCGIEDGMPYEHTASIEELQDGRWVTVLEYDADDI